MYSHVDHKHIVYLKRTVPTESALTEVLNGRAQKVKEADKLFQRYVATDVH